MAKIQVTVLVLIALATLAIYSLAPENEGNQMKFKLWKVKYGKAYSEAEEMYRLGVWFQNYDFVQKHNQKYEAGL